MIQNNRVLQAIVFSFLLLLSSSASLIEDSASFSPWDPQNDPRIILSRMNSKFSELKLEATLTKMPWSDDYWARRKGGIAYRWRSGVTPYSQGFKLYTLSELLKMNQAEIDRLSPTEKFDLLHGRYDYPLTKKVIQQNNPNAKSWEGICHGWSPASIHHPEAKPSTHKNSDGIILNFATSDVNALTSHYYAKVSGAKTKFLARRCRDESSNPQACEDINAGTLHILLTNQIGIRNESFIVDVKQGLEVWNHPVYSYSSQVIGERVPAPGSDSRIVREILVKTRMGYAIEAWPHLNPIGTSYNVDYYQYWLELDQSGKILGGSWESSHPDFAWTKEKAKFLGYHSLLKNLYQ